MNVNFEENLSKTRSEVSFPFFKIGRLALRHSMGESRPYQNIAQILFTKAKERHSIQTFDSEWVPSKIWPHKNTYSKDEKEWNRVYDRDGIDIIEKWMKEVCQPGGQEQKEPTGRTRCREWTMSTGTRGWKLRKDATLDNSGCFLVTKTLHKSLSMEIVD